MRSLTRIPPRVPEPRHQRAVIDTSVVIDLERVEPSQLPADLLIAATALAVSLPLYTRNPEDVEDLTSLLEIVAVELPS